MLPVSLGGEGVLRTTGRAKEAVPVILEALRLGVRYCDTAPAYQQSQDYYGEAFRAAGAAGARRRLPRVEDARAHARSRRCGCSTIRCAGSRTDRLDLWQMHDLRDMRELDVMCGTGGALEAAAQAQRDGRVRFVGLTGHHDPAVLVEAMRRFPFDSLLVSINPADSRYRPFLPTVVAEARRQGMGVVGMKVLAAGRLVREAPVPDLIRYGGGARRHGDRRLLQRRRGARQPRGQRRLRADGRQTNGAPSNRRSRRAPICTTPSRADRGRSRGQPRDSHSDFRYSTRSPFSRGR